MIARAPLIGIFAGVLALAVATYVKPTIRLVYNPSTSAPRGWYVVGPADLLRAGDYVVARLPNHIASFAADRDYLPSSVPILKQISAVGGQRVCIRQGAVYIDGAALTHTLDVDSRQRPLPTWKQCRLLLEGELFLLNVSNPASFDSRYFGPIDASFVRGRAVPVWTSEGQ